MIDRYAWPGGTEAWLKHGKFGQPLVIAALPPFEEGNRTRALLVRVLMQLTVHDIAVALPDLPGTGESLIGTSDVTLADWQQAFSSAAAQCRQDHPRVHGVALRAGALIDGKADLDSRWRLSPQDGPALHRELYRIAKAAMLEDGSPFSWPPTLIAGNPVSNDLLNEIETAVLDAPGPLRTLRLRGDAAFADRHVDAFPLWRRSEPDQDLELADLLADDIAEWIARCGR